MFLLMIYMTQLYCQSAWSSPPPIFLDKVTPGDGPVKIPPIGSKLSWNIIPINKIGFNVKHYNERYYLLSYGLDRSSQGIFKPFAKAFSLQWTNVTHKVLAVILGSCDLLSGPASL